MNENRRFTEGQVLLITLAIVAGIALMMVLSQSLG